MKVFNRPKGAARAALIAILVLFSLGPLAACAAMPTHPESDKDFLKLPNGVDLSQVKVSGVPLSLTTGAGQSFQVAQTMAYLELKIATQLQADHPVQWTLMDLDEHRVIEKSRNAGRPIFGASISKVFVAGTLLDKQAGEIQADQMQLLADMIVISSNDAWVNLQGQIGDGDQDLGRARNYAFTQRLGYARTRGYSGMWGTRHGNELTATELAEYLYDMYQGHFPGAEILWKVMHTQRLGVDRARKYLPTTQYVGGKTGDYDGPSIDPDTGLSTDADGNPYTVQVRHQISVFNLAGHEYGLVILANTGADESAALIAGGLYQELTALLGSKGFGESPLVRRSFSEGGKYWSPFEEETWQCSTKPNMISKVVIHTEEL